MRYRNFVIQDKLSWHAVEESLNRIDFFQFGCIPFGISNSPPPFAIKLLITEEYGQPAKY